MAAKYSNKKYNARSYIVRPYSARPYSARPYSAKPFKFAYVALFAIETSYEGQAEGLHCRKCIRIAFINEHRAAMTQFCSRNYNVTKEWLLKRRLECTKCNVARWSVEEEV